MPDYEIIDEHLPSRVCLMIRKDSKQYRFIDFHKFFSLAKKGNEANIEDYGSKKMEPN